jgi:hypothetical protein
MLETFRLGGTPMYPICALGLLSILAAVRYAVRPERRYVPLVVALGVSTLLTGVFGFVAGLSQSFLYIGDVKPEQRFLSIIGAGESLVNVSFAFALVAAAAIAVTVGTWRVARAAEAHA